MWPCSAQALLRHHHEQRLSSRRLEVDEQFVPELLAT